MSLRRNQHVRAVARHVPGLSRLYWSQRRQRDRLRGTAELDYPGATIKIRTNTDTIVRSRLFPLSKEPWTVDWLERNVREDDVLYDIGANVGVYSLIAAKVSPAARIVAFEPAYANYGALCDNLLLNGASEGVIPLPVVLGEQTELGSLSYTATDAGAALHTLGDLHSAAYRQPVLVYALDDLIDTFALAPPTLIKLDVDGSETAVLKGATATLSRPELRSVIVEVDETQTAAVTDQLEHAGLRLVARFDDRAGEPLPGVWYGIFARLS